MAEVADKDQYIFHLISVIYFFSYFGSSEAITLSTLESKFFGLDLVGLNDYLVLAFQVRFFVLENSITQYMLLVLGAIRPGVLEAT